MKTLQQSPELQQVFKNKVNTKVSLSRQAKKEALGGGILGSVGAVLFDIKHWKNRLAGSRGEWVVSTILKSLPDTWVMFNSALIPTKKVGNLTEIDNLIIGPGGIFLVEVKTWKGSYSVNKDKWKRREGNDWVEISASPSSQSAYHQKMFTQWIIAQIPDLSPDCITAPVVFTVADWVGTNNCSVPVLNGGQALLEMLLDTPFLLEPKQVLKIAEAVEGYTMPLPNPAISKPILKSKPKIKQNEV